MGEREGGRERERERERGRGGGGRRKGRVRECKFLNRLQRNPIELYQTVPEIYTVKYERINSLVV
jgi:hypothetical protein